MPGVISLNFEFYRFYFKIGYRSRPAGQNREKSALSRLRNIVARRLAQNAPLEHFAGFQPSLPMFVAEELINCRLRGNHKQSFFARLPLPSRQFCTIFANSMLTILPTLAFNLSEKKQSLYKSLRTLSGQAFTHSPQAVHFDLSISGRPFTRVTAPSGHFFVQIPHLKQPTEQSFLI